VVKIDVNRTELVWPGKYDEQGNRVVPPRVSLPFQVIETINESRATREAKKRPEQGTLFDIWSGDEGDTFEDGWRNKLIWGDNLLVMSSLLEKFAGKIDLIYIDPPFATGADFTYAAPVGEEGDEVERAPSLLEEKAYRDTWGGGMPTFLSMLAPRFELMRELLSPAGSIYVHVDYRTVHLVKLILDDVFGSANFRNHLIWVFEGRELSKTQFNAKHNDILFYTKGDGYTFRPERILEPLKESSRKAMSRFVDDDGRPYIVRYKAGGGFAPLEIEGETYRQMVPDGVLPRDWFFVDYARKDERTGYGTQKPESLLARVIQASSDDGDLVADFFAGSGTTAAVAEKLGRRWIACDLGRFAVHTSRKRLMGIKDARPFEVLNLGRYERQYWQNVSFGGRDASQIVFEYLAFILRLYGATPIAGLQHIHGKKGSAAIHVGNVDSPVTIGDVATALDECAATGQDELHVLGWEWEMGLNDLVDQLAVDRKVRLKLLAIPREVMEAQAVEKKDIRFFELAHLAADFVSAGQRTIKAQLTNFVMSGAEGIDPEILAKIEKWSDFVDYWAVDWDFKNDTFVNGWVAYRTRKERRLPLETDPHRHDASGTYAVAVKVVDVFGNDTTRVFPVEVK
jgi:adenine-specific DNA-methyltransferase